MRGHFKRGGRGGQGYSGHAFSGHTYGAYGAHSHGRGGGRGGGHRGGRGGGRGGGLKAYVDARFASQDKRISFCEEKIDEDRRTSAQL